MDQSLARRKHELSSSVRQLEILDDFQSIGIPSFKSKIAESGLFPLQATGIDILQINVGKMCNQVCKHCHVDAGPDRKEIMTRGMMRYCLDAIKSSGIKTVDITGGAPELNPNFFWFVEELFALGVQTIVRCNLTIILANPKYNDLPEFYKKHKIHVISSLPHFTQRRTDAQRGQGVFEKSIKVMQMLNDVGYGKDSDLRLDLVYNPTGAFLPDDQIGLEQQYKKKLFEEFGIVFNELLAITNIPVSRFLDYLLVSDNYEDYMNELVDAYNPVAAKGVMCRNTLSVGWDGSLYDCDFNQMLEMKLENGLPAHIKDFSNEQLKHRLIQTSQHCYGCTAGAGSSCGGAIV